MPRPNVQPRGNTGKRLAKAMRELQLSPQEVAAAARIHKGTLYKLLVGKTKRPHHGTLRRLCKVLGVDIAELLGAEQLQLALFGRELERTGVLTELEELLVAEILSFSSEDAKLAVAAVVAAVRETKLGEGQGISNGPRPYTVDEILTEIHSFTIEEAVENEMRQLSREMRLVATRTALGVLVDLKLLKGAAPSSELYRRITRLRYRVWLPMERPKRHSKAR